MFKSGNKHQRPWGWLPDVSPHGFRADPCDIFHNLSKKKKILLQHMCWRGSEGFCLYTGTSTPPDTTFGQVLKMMFKNGKPHQGSWGWVTNVSPNSFHADPYDIFHNLSKKIKRLFVSYLYLFPPPPLSHSLSLSLSSPLSLSLSSLHQKY